jgi:adenine/guanine/hypoxanthine permease
MAGYRHLWRPERGADHFGGSGLGYLGGAGQPGHLRCGRDHARFGGVQYFRGKVPAGLVAIGVGCIIAWGSTIFGLNYGGLNVQALAQSFSNFGFAFPTPAVSHVFSGFQFLGVILVTAIPFGIYDLVEAMDNVESASVAGDSFPTTRVLTADGVVSLIGCLMGNPFIDAVYIGHPGGKAMGGRIGYSAATGVMVILMSWLGIISLMLALIPVVAISPILLYIGMLIGAQAFQETPQSHAPAIVMALTPHLAAWGKLQIDNALAAAGTSAAAVGLDKLGQTGVVYRGLEVLGGGAILAGLILGAIGVFVIERQFLKAAAFSVAGALLTFFGFIHGEKIGWGQTPWQSAIWRSRPCFRTARSLRSSRPKPFIWKNVGWKALLSREAGSRSSRSSLGRNIPTPSR